MSYPIGSREVGPEAQPGQARIRRSNVSPDVLITEPQEGVHTVYDVLQYTARTYSDKDALGWRDVENIIEEEKEVTKVRIAVPQCTGYSHTASSPGRRLRGRRSRRRRLGNISNFRLTNI